MPHADLQSLIRNAAEAIANSDALLIGAGAGMGVDSGLPDFRGPEGFWKAYPPFRGYRFSEISNPRWFRTDPELAWGFFGHRMHLYRTAIPHRGFTLLREWGGSRPLGFFVFTSNVDGQFQKEGFSEDQVVECHGSIHHLQCTLRCERGIWPATGVDVEIDEAAIRATSRLPTCPDCGAIARPNILMFDDGEWDSTRTDRQYNRYSQWLRRVEGRKLVAIELGAGLAIPTVRLECESRARILIRINPRDPEAGREVIAIPLGALEALESIRSILESD